MRERESERERERECVCVCARSPGLVTAAQGTEGHQAAQIKITINIRGKKISK